MRTLAITQNITLDGRVEMLGDWFQAQAQGDQDDLLEENERQDTAADGFVVGRQTFTDLRGYWRDLADDNTGVSEYLNRVAKHVVTSTITNPEWAGTSVLDPAAGVVEQVRALKEGSDGGSMDIVVTGSITLCHTLIAAGLVDEYRFFTYPVVQGAGRGLFPDGYEATGLCPLRQLTFRSGITFQSWSAR